MMTTTRTFVCREQLGDDDIVHAFAIDGIVENGMVWGCRILNVVMFVDVPADEGGAVDFFVAN